ncbi:MAG: NAD(P)-dependent dehydrogenase (short-subunit alcohol dehydrogenase family) [Candidatus Azotimanducaceae bacterium]|jgi:NAD(P)-dependent dehydrogenase (short-subunit alcohol dehydrogenase family)|tara:strand:- start:2745 stop:3566 length:822 start_codon:yes stop_codon:yes gene_type:complete
MTEASNYRNADHPALDLTSLFGLSGKVAIVTGGSRGIGYMIAAGLVANGVKVYITARKAAACDAAAAELSEHGECISIPGDMSTPEGIDAFVAAVTAQEDQIDILVNNAGAAWGAPLGEFPAIGFDKVMDINVKAPFMLTQALLPQLKASGTAEDPARVVMIGSIDGIRVPHGDNYSYSASKAAIHMMTRHMAAHLVGEHILLNSIAPGPFPSKMMAYMLEDEERSEFVTSSNPRKRIGTAQDIAGAVIFLSSRAGAYTTGTVIPVDGGISTL